MGRKTERREIQGEKDVEREKERERERWPGK